MEVFLNNQFSLKNKKGDKTILLLKNKKVFTPTETTKFLIEGLLKNFPKRKVDILDLGCGNGVIGIYLLKNYTNINSVTFSDISDDALKIAKKNCDLNLISEKKYKLIKSNVFNKISNTKFDIIINDVSGISSKVAKMSDWFNNVPCNSGIDGTKLTLKVLNHFSAFLKPGGSLYLPIISLSNENKIYSSMKKKKIKFKQISINNWPIPKSMYNFKNSLIRLNKTKKINLEEKYGLLIANTKILKLKI
tara:strand:- start:1149 stop:1892 length:744 start_codon:yes stop_codon:yes gene_type:complete